MKTNQELVLEIHEAFDTAADSALIEARQILAAGFPKEKEARLRNLGFAPSKASVNFEKAEEQKKLILHYQHVYPNNKFITAEIAKAICEKYGLLLGSVSSYVGDVPESNLREIEAFKVKKDDYKEESSWLFGGIDPFSRLNEPRLFRSNNDASMALGWALQSRNGRIRSAGIQEESREIQMYKEAMWSEYREKEVKPSFKICAPASDFDTQGLKQVGHELVPEDPIVLCPVNGGYLVVSKWGLEANDPSVTNEKLN